MNGVRSKELRRRIFGDFSIKERKYESSNGGKRCAGRRNIYRSTKRALRHPATDAGRIKGKLQVPKWLGKKKEKFSQLELQQMKSH